MILMCMESEAPDMDRLLEEPEAILSFGFLKADHLLEEPKALDAGCLLEESKVILSFKSISGFSDTRDKRRRHKDFQDASPKQSPLGEVVYVSLNPYGATPLLPEFMEGFTLAEGFVDVVETIFGQELARAASIIVILEAYFEGALVSNAKMDLSRVEACKVAKEEATTIIGGGGHPLVVYVSLNPYGATPLLPEFMEGFTLAEGFVDVVETIFGQELARAASIIVILEAYFEGALVSNAKMDLSRVEACKVAKEEATTIIGGGGHPLDYDDDFCMEVLACLSGEHSVNIPHRVPFESSPPLGPTKQDYILMWLDYPIYIDICEEDQVHLLSWSLGSVGGEEQLHGVLMRSSYHT
ncbi:hypothetical protein ACLOJK_005855 [Asimina triloba]